MAVYVFLNGLLDQRLAQTVSHNLITKPQHEQTLESAWTVLLIVQRSQTEMDHAMGLVHAVGGNTQRSLPPPASRSLRPATRFDPRVTSYPADRRAFTPPRLGARVVSAVTEHEADHLASQLERIERMETRLSSLLARLETNNQQRSAAPAPARSLPPPAKVYPLPASSRKNGLQRDHRPPNAHNSASSANLRCDHCGITGPHSTPGGVCYVERPDLAPPNWRPHPAAPHYAHVKWEANSKRMGLTAHAPPVSSGPGQGSQGQANTGRIPMRPPVKAMAAAVAGSVDMNAPPLPDGWYDYGSDPYWRDDRHDSGRRFTHATHVMMNDAVAAAAQATRSRTRPAIPQSFVSLPEVPAPPSAAPQVLRAAGSPAAQGGAVSGTAEVPPAHLYLGKTSPAGLTLQLTIPQIDVSALAEPLAALLRGAGVQSAPVPSHACALAAVLGAEEAEQHTCHALRELPREGAPPQPRHPDALQIERLAQFNLRRIGHDKFVNAHPATGVGIDINGRYALLEDVMLDNGSQVDLITASYAKALGLSTSPAPGMTLQMADGTPTTDLQQSTPVHVIFCKGTPYECSVGTRFIVVPDSAAHIYKVLLGKGTLSHHGGAMDEWLSRWTYRPFLQSHADDELMHAVPTISIRPSRDESHAMSVGVTVLPVLTVATLPARPAPPSSDSTLCASEWGGSLCPYDSGCSELRTQEPQAIPKKPLKTVLRTLSTMVSATTINTLWLIIVLASLLTCSLKGAVAWAVNNPLFRRAYTIREHHQRTHTLREARRCWWNKTHVKSSTAKHAAGHHRRTTRVVEWERPYSPFRSRCASLLLLLPLIMMACAVPTAAMHVRHSPHSQFSPAAEVTRSRGRQYPQECLDGVPMPSLNRPDLSSAHASEDHERRRRA